MFTARYVLHSTFCPHSVFMCFVWIWEQTAIISLYSIDWLDFITETECVYCAVRTEVYILIFNWQCHGSGGQSMSGFHHRPVHVWFLVDKVAPWHVSLPVSFIPPMLHIHLLAEAQPAEARQALNKTNAHQEVGVKWIGSTFTFWPSSQSGFPFEMFNVTKRRCRQQPMRFKH